jgi:putative transposase
LSHEAACPSAPNDPYDFPAEHWRHLRTTNPIESTFATIRLGHRRAEFDGTGGHGTTLASLAMMFKLAQSAARHWHKLNSPERIRSLLEGKGFTDGILQLTHAA